jgi:hypothetical protein
LFNKTTVPTAIRMIAPVTPGAPRLPGAAVTERSSDIASSIGKINNIEAW